MMIYHFAIFAYSFKYELDYYFVFNAVMIRRYRRCDDQMQFVGLDLLLYLIS